MEYLTLLEDLGLQKPTETSTYNRRYGLYQCKCGNTTRAQMTQVKSGHTKSCGCLQKEAAITYQTKHGLHSHPLYSVWKGMNARCNSKTNKAFPYYGGRGISVCDEWKKDFKTYYDWAIANGYEKGLTIDRRDNDGNYTPENCRFTTPMVQARNTRAIRSNNTSGYRGVSWNKCVGKFHAAICVAYEVISLGYFDDPEEASKVFNKYVIDNDLEHLIKE